METTDCYCKYEYEASSSESLLLGLLVVAAVASTKCIGPIDLYL